MSARWTMPATITITYPDSVEVYRDSVTFTTARGRRRAIRALQKRTRNTHHGWKSIEWSFDTAWMRAPREVRS